MDDDLTWDFTTGTMPEKKDHSSSMPNCQATSKPVWGSTSNLGKVGFNPTVGATGVPGPATPDDPSYGPGSGDPGTPAYCRIPPTPAGYTGADGDAATACAEDTYKGATGSAGCTACPANSKTGGATGSTAVTACEAPAGYTGADGDAATACAEDTYKGATGSAGCTACPANSKTGGATGATNEDDCQAAAVTPSPSPTPSPVPSPVTPSSPGSPSPSPGPSPDASPRGGRIKIGTGSIKLGSGSIRFGNEL